MSIWSWLQAAPYLDDGSLVQVLPEWSHPQLPIHLVYPPNRHLNARVRAFADWAIALFGSTPALQARGPLPAPQEASTTLH